MPIYFANAMGMFGADGLTVIRCSLGETTKSMSSMGMAPNNTWSPITKAPTKQSRPSIETRTGPAYLTSWCEPSAVTTSRSFNAVSLNCKAICSGMQR